MMRGCQHEHLLALALALALFHKAQPRFVQSHHPLIVEQSYPFKFN